MHHRIVRRAQGLALALVLTLAVPAWAAPTAEQAREIDEAAKRIEEGRYGAEVPRVLSEQYGIDRSTADALPDRNQGQGWGEIVARTAFARQLSKMNPSQYATTADALQKAREAREQSGSWDQAASSIDPQFDLGAVRDAVRRTADTLSGSTPDEAGAGTSTADAGSSAATEQARQLRQAQQAIDDVASRSTDEKHADALESEIGVGEDVVNGLRERYRDKGWGEIAIQLAMAKQLSKMNPSSYADTKAALPRIEELRREGKGWDEIARSIDPQFKLDPVVDSVEGVRDAFRSHASAAGARS